VLHTVEASLAGRIAMRGMGTNGFGYDPIFVPDGFDRTLGQIDPADKALISHRAAAFGLLVEACFRSSGLG
jgi:XTP/dITP diphosphohydrolase